MFVVLKLYELTKGLCNVGGMSGLRRADRQWFFVEGFHHDFGLIVMVVI